MDKRSYKLWLDITLFVSVLLLMPYILVGEVLHEILGVFFLILILLHLSLNLKWVKAIPKGGYSLKRLILTIVNVSMALCAILVIFSGLMVSHYLLNIHWQISSMRAIHLVASHWLFLLMGLHLGFHLKLKYIYCLSPIAIYGCYVLVRGDFINYLLYNIHFIFFDKHVAFVIADYLSIIIFFAVLSGALNKTITKR